MERYNGSRRTKHNTNWFRSLAESDRPVANRTSRSNGGIVGGVDAGNDPLIRRALSGETISFYPADDVTDYQAGSNFEGRVFGVNGKRTTPIDLGRSSRPLNGRWSK